MQWDIEIRREKGFRFLLKTVFLSIGIVTPMLVKAQSVTHLNHLSTKYKEENVRAVSKFSNDYISQLNKNTYIPSVYEDGSGGTLGQIARMADEAILQDDIDKTVAGIDSNGFVTANIAGNVTASQVNISTPNSVVRILSDKLREHPSVVDYGATLGVNDSAHDIPLFQKAYADNPINKTGYLEIPAGFWPHNSNGTIWTPDSPQYMYLKFLGAVGWNNKGWSHIWSQLNSDLIEQYVNRTLEFDRAFLTPAAWPVPTVVYNQTFANQGVGRSYNGITEAIRINQENRPNVPGSMVGGSVYQYVKGNKGYANQHASIHLDTVRTGSDGVWNIWPSVEDKMGYGPDSGDHAPQQFDGMEMDYTGNGSDRNQLMGGGGRTFIRFVPSAFADWKIWSANRSYTEGEIVADPKKTNLYKVVKGGRSGSTEPRFEKEGKIADGDVIWQFVNTISMEQGHAILFGGGGNSKASYNNLIGGNANVNLAVLDTSNMNLDTLHGAIIRGSDGQPLDLCGKTFNKSPKVGRYNQCTLRYSSDQNGFIFSLNGKTILNIKNDGTITSENGISLSVKTRSEIRSMTVPTGTMVYDRNDDAPAVYTNRGWKVVTLKDMPSD